MYAGDPVKYGSKKNPGNVRYFREIYQSPGRHE